MVVFNLIMKRSGQETSFIFINKYELLKVRTKKKKNQLQI